MGRTRVIALAAVVASSIVVGIAVAAAVDPPSRAFLAADAVPIGTGLDRPWYLGGFSDLYPDGASGKEFWTITDRGPNYDGGVGGIPCATGTKVYPLPGFTPEIVRIGRKDDEIKGRVQLRFGSGAAVGFSVRPAGRNEVSLDAGCDPLGTSPRGIDSEGLVVDPRDGSFWLADEYLPSVLHVASDGTVLARLVPAGTEASVTGTGATIVMAFPETVGTNFRPNRGFEGIAISPDGQTLYTALQSPMEYRPTGAERPSPNPRNSLAIRVFRIDISNAGAPATTAQWIYALANGAGGSPAIDKISTLTWVGVDRLAVEERDDPANDPNDNPQNTTFTKLYVADFTAVAPIPTGSVWNGTAGAATGGKSLEQWYIPGQGTGAPNDLPGTAPKCLWADIAAMLRDAGFTDPSNPARAGNGKIEGVAYVKARGSNPALLAVVNDNDFGLVVPISEQLDVLQAPPLCTPS